MKKIFVILLFFILPLVLHAQRNVDFIKDNFPDQKEQFKAAVKAIEAGDAYYAEAEFQPVYDLALEEYLKAQKFNPNNAELNLKIGKCYLHSLSFDKVLSLPYLLKSYQLNPNLDKKIHFYLGRGHHFNHEWDKAIKEYNIYKSKLVKEEYDEQGTPLEKYIAECRRGKELEAKPVSAFIDNLGEVVNTLYPDFGPIISADEQTMIFTARRDNSTGGALADDYHFFEDLYISHKVNGKWSSPKNMGSPINTKEHDATAGLSPDGTRLIIYRDDDGGDLFECDLKGDTWTKPDKLPKTINTKYHETTASFSYDGKTLYFVSNRPDLSMGGHDIFMSQLTEKGEWGEPQNLGPTINTPFDEEGVFMMPDGKTMYFSSRGHGNIGGYDIFKTEFVNGKWSEPENLGIPINTPDDDVFFVVSASGKYGYYASAKKDGFGEKDIYRITFLGPEKPVLLNTEDNLLASIAEPIVDLVTEPEINISRSWITIFKGHVYDSITRIPLESEIEMVDNNNSSLVGKFVSNSLTGRFLVTIPSGRNYGLAVKCPGYLFHSENFDIPYKEEYQEVSKDILLKKPKVGTSIVLRNIFFDFDKAVLRPTSTAELEKVYKLLMDNPKMKIELSGHTDSRGGAEYNVSLSDRRAKAVVAYLIEKGISADRLTSKGYGLSRPIDTNDTEEGRQNNRRTEMKITAF